MFEEQRRIMAEMLIESYVHLHMKADCPENLEKAIVHVTDHHQMPGHLLQN